MSRSSAPERVRVGPSSSADRGQVDPLPALAAVAVVGLALALYAGSLGTLPDTADEADTPDGDATVALGAVCERLCVGGRVDPADLDDALAAAPDGHRLRIVLRADGEEWTAGPAPPADAAGAARTVTVRVGPAETVPGRLRVVVWE